jgi:hypothetical protein
MMYSSVVLAAGLATLAQAFTQPGQQTWGPLLTPDTTDAVTQGKTFTVTWDPQDHPTDGVTVSLVLCHGPGSNCVLQDSAIVEKLPAAQKSYDWQVPCSLTPGVQSTSTGYGMLIIVDGTGEFQYSTQFSVEANSACGSSSSTTGSTAPSSSSGSPSSTKASSTGSAVVIGPPAYATSTYGPSGNLSTTVTATNAPFPGSTYVSTASDGRVWTYGGSTYAVTATPTPEGGATTMTTSPVGTLTSTRASGTSSAGSANSAAPFNGGAVGQLGSSMAGMVIAGAVAVFAF